MNNKIIISAAGSGKTTYLVSQALNVVDETVLITTYTEANETEIKRKIYEQRGCIPSNITVMTWFTFLLKHGVRPYQDTLDAKLHDKKIGFFLTNQKSGKRSDTTYWGEKDFRKFYFGKSLKIYSDKISKFILNTNVKSKNLVFDRISKIFNNIFIDEVQDLAGYDYELLRLLFRLPNSVLLVGDPRQVTYLTHPSQKYKKYSDGKLIDFINDEINKKETICKIDTETLNLSHRNNKKICDYSSRLYPDFPVPSPCNCCSNDLINHQGIYVIRPPEIDKYIDRYNPVQLRWNRKKGVSEKSLSMNMGESKGLSFDRTLIYPTAKMINWIKSNKSPLNNETRAKLYVALTRARYSATFVFDYQGEEEIPGIQKYLFGEKND